jgi:hypothetical protein
MIFARSSAMRSDMPSAREVSSSTTPRLTAASGGDWPAVLAEAAGTFGIAARIAAAMIERCITGYHPYSVSGSSG